MLHIHRHITGLKSFSPVVIAQKEEGIWPVPVLERVRRSKLRFMARALAGSAPWQVSRREVRDVLQMLERHQAKLLHVFFGNVAIHLLPLLRVCPIPVVVSFHGSDVSGAIAGEDCKAARGELFDRVSLVLCRSEQLAGRVREMGCPASKIRLMRTVLPEISYVQRMPPADESWRIVQASRLVPKKGIATALDAFAIFRESFPAARFTVAGEGPLLDELKSKATQLGIAGSVEFAGFLDQDGLRALFAASHLYLHPSETVDGDVEGVPNALLEAMASGLPAVATEHGGIPEVITHGKTGLLVPEHSPEKLANALLQLANNPGLAGTIARDGSEEVRTTFSQERQIANIEALYREAVR